MGSRPAYQIWELVHLARVGRNGPQGIPTCHLAPTPSPRQCEVLVCGTGAGWWRDRALHPYSTPSVRPSRRFSSSSASPPRSASSRTDIGRAPRATPLLGRARLLCAPPALSRMRRGQIWQWWGGSGSSGLIQQRLWAWQTHDRLDVLFS